MFMSPLRDVDMEYRNKQIKSVARLLETYTQSGRISFSNPADQVAEQIVLLSAAVWLVWSVRPIPLPELNEKLIAGLSKLVRD